MKTITIPESEYLKMKQTITELQQKLSLFQDEDFILKLKMAYNLFITQSYDTQQRVPLQRGAAKHIITYMADDFTM